MAVPKKLLQDLLRAVPPARLQRIARRNFTRMQGLTTVDEFVERLSTPSKAFDVVMDLSQAELEPLAAILKVDPTGLSHEELMGRIGAWINSYDDMKKAESGGGMPASTTLELLQKGVESARLLPHIGKRRMLSGAAGLTEGEIIAEANLGVAFAGGEVRFTDAYEVFKRCGDQWPEPILSKLRLVGAPKTADMLIASLSSLLPAAPSDISGSALQKALSSLPMDSHTNAKSRKQWKEAWQKTGENLDQLTRSYLLARPELF